MKKRWSVVLSMLLCIALLCPLWSALGTLSVRAAEPTYFIFEALGTEQHGYKPDADDCITLPLTDATVFTAQNTVTMDASGAANALRIVLLNNSNATALHVTYDYFLDAPHTATVSHTLAASDEEQELLLKTPNIANRDSADQLTLSFECEGTPSGNIVLLAFYDVTVYDGEEDAAEGATFTRCEYVAEENAILISGSVNVNVTMRYEGATLALFALSPEDRDFYLFSKTDVARTEVGRSFEFSVSAETAEEIFARYLVAVVTETGERIPLCSPVYPDIPSAAASQEIGFKGYHADSIFSVIDSGAGVEIVDVYLDRLRTTQSSENVILYAGDHDYYYFDSVVIGELDNRVKNLTGAGCTVFLRFLISPEANGFSFVTHTDNAAGIINKGIDIEDESALLDVHAMTDFLTARYTDRETGKIDGIILGRRADYASVYAYIGSWDLESYAEKYVAALSLISGTARMNIPDVRMIVPVSDHINRKGITADHLTGAYFPDLFLQSLLAAMEATMLTPPAISVMMETDALPELIGESNGTDACGIDGVGDFLGMVRLYAASYPFLDAKILCNWNPVADRTEEELNAAYALQYISLALEERIHSFIVDFSLISEGKRAQIAEGLYYLISCIDTAKNISVLSPILESLDVTPKELWSTYDPAALQTRAVIKTNMQEGGYDGDQQPLGSYELFGFTSTTDLQNWYGGYACGELTVQNQTLHAMLSPTDGAKYAEVAYHFNQVRDLSFAPLMRVSLGIAGQADTPYELRLQLLGEHGVISASAIAMVGENQEFYLDLSQFADQLTRIGAIRVQARPLRSGGNAYTLSLGGLTLESTELTAAQLAERLAAQANSEKNEQPEQQKRDYTTPILVSVLLLIASLALVAILVVRHYRDRNKQGKKALHTENSEEK